MKIWLINHYASTMFIDKGGRHYSLAKYLKRMGHQPVVICCNALHEKPSVVEKTEKKFFIKHDDKINVPFVFVSGRIYEGNGKDRLMNILDFYRNLMCSYKSIIKEIGGPDIILGSSIHPLAPIAAVKLAHRLGCKCVCEFRDLWPDELICMGVMRENSLPAVLLRCIEHWTYKRADALVFTMEGATEYIKKRGWDKDSGGKVDLSKAFYINNGVDIEDYNYNLTNYKVEDNDLDNPDLFKVIYTGMIRRANGIDKILNIAKQLNDCPQIKFLLYGAGNEVDDIIKQIDEENISNVEYKGNLNKKYIPYVLNKSNINILNYMNGDLFRYGCSNNKLFEYMASGKPILCTISMNYSILKKYHCGLEVDETAQVDEIANKIRELYYNPDMANEYRQNTVDAIKNFDYLYLAKLLDNVMQGL